VYGGIGRVVNCLLTNASFGGTLELAGEPLDTRFFIGKWRRIVGQHIRVLMAPRPSNRATLLHLKEERYENRIESDSGIVTEDTDFLG
jgi:hypothetical protein